MKHPVIALLTDFGDEDFFVASVKGVILRINPAAQIIDVTHKIPAHDVRVAAFVLHAAYRYFPSGTVFLAVVDPGVGTDRRVLLAKTRDHYFIAPDNGILSQVLKQEKIETLRELTNPRYYLGEVSRTFEGRDRMAPAAAWLSIGVTCENFGPETVLYKKMTVHEPQSKKGWILGHILYADRFGNLITNIPEGLIKGLKKGKSLSIMLKSGEVKTVCGECYSFVKKGDLLVLTGSLGLVEIAVREGSAARKLKLKAGDPVDFKLTNS